MTLRVFLHAWQVGAWRSIVDEQLAILADDDGVVVNATPADDTEAEIPTLRLLHAAARAEPAHTFLYAHTKGVTRPDDPCAPLERNLLNELVLRRRREHIAAVEGGGFDVSGVKWRRGFVSNFWVARGAWLAALPPIDDHVAWFVRRFPEKHRRFAAVSWLASGPGRVRDAAPEPGMMFRSPDWWRRRPHLRFGPK